MQMIDELVEGSVGVGLGGSVRVGVEGSVGVEARGFY